MSDNQSAIDPEVVLIALDQVGQAIEVLSASVSRLQYYVQTNTPLPLQSELPFVDPAIGIAKRELH